MRLRDVMNTGVITIGPDELVSTARATMRRHRIRHLVVVEDGEVVGVVSERDLGGTGPAAPVGDPPVRAVMTTDVVTATPAMTLRQAANLMRGRTVGSLPVVDGDRVVGLITVTDLLDQFGRGAVRPTVTLEQPPLRRPPGVGRVHGRAARGPTGPRRGRRPQATSVRRRAPLPAAMPRATKRARGRTAEPPAHIRVMGGELPRADRDEIARKLGARLGKFAEAIERISVRLADVNGPKGGVDQLCLIKVVLRGLPSVVVERRAATLRRAVAAAIDATGLAVQRAVQRRRLEPLHGRGRAAAATA